MSLNGPARYLWVGEGIDKCDGEANRPRGALKSKDLYGAR